MDTTYGIDSTRLLSGRDGTEMSLAGRGEQVAVRQRIQQKNRTSTPGEVQGVSAERWHSKLRRASPL